MLRKHPGNVSKQALTLDREPTEVRKQERRHSGGGAGRAAGEALKVER